VSGAPILSTLTLPAELVAEDVFGLRDQLGARLAAVIRPKGHKHQPNEVALPDGIAPLGALPPHIDLPWKRFDGAVNELQAFRHARASAQADVVHAAGDENEQDAANADSDDRWRAIEQWNKGAAGLREDGKAPSPSEARWLYGQLFPTPEGLRFITRRPRVQWAAMEQRMNVLHEKRAQAVIAGFGGERHWEQLAASHDRFGKAFGFTTVVPDDIGGPTDGRPQWITAREALRTLVQKVETYADPELAGSQALVTFLLRPYVELVDDLARSRRPARAKKADPAAASAPLAGNPTTG
jgi:hypothetical protein